MIDGFNDLLCLHMSSPDLFLAFVKTLAVFMGQCVLDPGSTCCSVSGSER